MSSSVRLLIVLDFIKSGPDWSYFHTCPQSLRWLWLQHGPHRPCSLHWQCGADECPLGVGVGWGCLFPSQISRSSAGLTQIPTEQLSLVLQAIRVRSALLSFFVKWAIMPGSPSQERCP